MNGARILDMTRAHLARFVTFPSQAALDVATVWAAATHVVGTDERLSFDTAPRIAFVSDLPGSGKTAAMDLVLAMSFRGRQVISPTPLSFCTLLSEERATPGLDEIDNLFGAGQAKMDLRAILNAGYRRGQTFSRGKQDRIDIFAMVALAGLGKRFRVASELAPLRSRSFVIEMIPRDNPDAESFSISDHGPMTAMHRDRLTAWARQNHRAILTARPPMPAGIDNRNREIVDPLLKVAATAGGHWPATIADAARAILLGQVDEADPSNVDIYDRLLLDLREVYEAAGAAKLPTRDIVAGLYDLPASTWARLWPNPNTAPRELASMLAPLGVEPRPMDLDGKTVRGYPRWSLEPLWEEITSITAISDVSISDDGDELIDLDA